jgi:hypothetical protein
MAMIVRALAVWVAMLVSAILNGAFREMFLIPQLGDAAGRAVSTLMLSALVILLTWSTVPWIDPRSSRDEWAIGIGWMALTLAFEFLAGHYLFGKPWSELTADYDVLRGRIWVVVLMTIAVAPRVCGQLRESATAAVSR